MLPTSRLAAFLICLGAFLVSMAAPAALLVSSEACTKQQGAALQGVVTTVAADTCRELESQPEPAWVLLACSAEGALTSEGGPLGEVATVRVRIPRAQWAAIKAGASSSPGK